MSDRFQLSVQIELQKLQPDGQGWTGERMTVNERFTVGAAGFTEVAAILGKFHDLADKIELEQQ